MARSGLILVAMLAASLSSPVHAYTGLELKKACNNESTFCTDYVGVISDSMIRNADPKYCLPFSPTTAYKQLRDAVTKYLNDHPDELHRNAAALTTEALHFSFPCKGGKWVLGMDTRTWEPSGRKYEYTHSSDRCPVCFPKDEPEEVFADDELVDELRNDDWRIKRRPEGLPVNDGAEATLRSR